MPLKRKCKPDFCLHPIWLPHGKNRNGTARQRCGFCLSTRTLNPKGRETCGRKPSIKSVWPFRAADCDIITKVNKALPKTLPEYVRADAAQDMILDYFLGVERPAKEYISRNWPQYYVSLDYPAFGLDKPLKEFLSTDGSFITQASSQRF